MTVGARLLLAAICLFVTTNAEAEMHHVDDSRSQVLGSAVRLKPVAPLAHGNGMNVVSGDIAVLVRLDVAPWKGRQGRIYMTLPDQSGAPVTATWNSRGRLMPGVLRSGGRTPVYAGLIQDDTIEDTLRLNIQGDERTMPSDQQLAFAFEIDLDTP